MAAGREAVARQVGELRKDGLDAWAWLPSRTKAGDLAAYAADHGAELVLLSSDDADLVADLRDLGRHEAPDAGRRVRVETVPV
jgi:hypothetical protein